MANTRISKKFLANLPEEVANYINGWYKDGYVKSIAEKRVAAPYRLYNGEGYRFFVYKNGRVMSLETVSSDSLGAANVNHDICGSTLIPAETIVVEVAYYCGYHMTIYYVGYPEIA